MSVRILCEGFHPDYFGTEVQAFTWKPEAVLSCKSSGRAYVLSCKGSHENLKLYWDASHLEDACSIGTGSTPASNAIDTGVGGDDVRECAEFDPPWSSKWEELLVLCTVFETRIRHVHRLYRCIIWQLTTALWCINSKRLVQVKAIVSWRLLIFYWNLFSWWSSLIRIYLVYIIAAQSCLLRNKHPALWNALRFWRFGLSLLLHIDSNDLPDCQRWAFPWHGISTTGPRCDSLDA